MIGARQTAHICVRFVCSWCQGWEWHTTARSWCGEADAKAAGCGNVPDSAAFFLCKSGVLARMSGQGCPDYRTTDFHSWC